MEKELTCPICAAVFYKPVAVIPCLHKFCSSCISGWIVSNDTCPQCRNTCKEVRKDHAVASLVTTYLNMHPKKKRSDEELRDLDAADTIKSEVVKVGAHNSDDDDENSNSDDSSEEEDDVPRVIMPHHMMHVQLPPAAVCRECTVARTDDGFQCNNTTIHMQCSACMAYMPQRAPPSVAQRCEMCNGIFCNMYYGRV